MRTEAPRRSTSGRRDRHRSARLVRWLALPAVVVTMLLLGASPAAAHLGLASSDPADGARLTTAPSSVRLVFTRSADAVGAAGVRLLDQRGRTVSASLTSEKAGTTWVLSPRVPLAPGAYRVTWKVVAQDAHVRTGALRFTVTDAIRGAPTAGPSGAAPAAVPSAASGEVGGMDPAMSHGTHPGATGAGAASPTGAQAPQAAEQELPGETDGAAGRSGRAAELLGTAGRWAGVIGVLVAVGALLVAVTTLVGSAGDVRLTTTVVRAGAVLAAVGAAAEAVSLVLAMGTALPVQAAAAVAARGLGGVVLAGAGRLTPRRAGGRRSQDVAALPPASGDGGIPAAVSGRRRSPSTVLDRPLLAPPVQVSRVRPAVGRPVPVWSACLLLLGSFALDGHTASTEPRLVMVLADLVHVTGGAVWSGGVVLLGCLLLVRARAGVPTGAGELAVRFSVPASAAALAVGAAGLVMLLQITDDVGQLLSTPWGRAMAAKLVLVGVVALLGYANNRYAVPALDAWQPHTARLLRRTVAVEAAVMLCVMGATAVLVVSPATL